MLPRRLIFPFPTFGDSRMQLHIGWSILVTKIECSHISFYLYQEPKTRKVINKLKLQKTSSCSQQPSLPFQVQLPFSS